MGVDRVNSLDYDRLPDSAPGELAALLGLREEHRAWPRQVLLALGTLLLKRSSGDRVIGPCPTWADGGRRPARATSEHGRTSAKRTRARPSKETPLFEKCFFEQLMGIRQFASVPL